jgi:hypothetical protein
MAKRRYCRKTRGGDEKIAARQCHVMVSEILKKTTVPDAAMQNLWLAAADSGEFSGQSPS